MSDAESTEPTDYITHRQTLAKGIRSIAVMPISNYTGDESKEYIAQGVHADLIGKLEQLGDIKVISKTSTLPFSDFKISLNPSKGIALMDDYQAFETLAVHAGETAPGFSANNRSLSAPAEPAACIRPRWPTQHRRRSTVRPRTA